VSVPFRAWLRSTRNILYHFAAETYEPVFEKAFLYRVAEANVGSQPFCFRMFALHLHELASSRSRANVALSVVRSAGLPS